jgi:hypothetical protein
MWQSGRARRFSIGRFHREQPSSPEPRLVLTGPPVTRAGRKARSIIAASLFHDPRFSRGAIRVCFTIFSRSRRAVTNFSTLPIRVGIHKQRCQWLVKSRSRGRI